MSSDTINPCGYNITAPCDDNSHGTHTMGTMVGDDGAGNQIGVAPGAKWIACRNMERGNGAPSTYIECFEFFLAPTDINGENADPTKAPHVINNSWYCSEGEGCNPSNFEFMHTAVTNLKAAGVVVVVSNGNFGGPCNTSNNPPAFFAESFSVGATTSIDSIASFSSRGPVTIDGSNRTKPDISAPGQDVRSSIPNGGYANYSGTSMAGPHVAGVVGLMVSANPAIAGEVETIENIIKTTAIPRTSGDLCGTVEGWNIPNNTYGHGRINAFEAVKSALLYTPNKEINTYREGEIDIFPNPFYNYLDIDLKGNDWNGVAYFKLYDASGKEIMFDKWNTELSKSVRINIPAGLNSGMYYYQIVAEHSRACGKLIK
ncbi:MAG: S8 family peptidase [Saprospiraceae bacterium]|nr:S8 family peptidase [Saprospiraceae bacterium]